MGNKKSDDAWNIAIVRKAVLQYFGAIPQQIKTHGGNCVGSVSLQLGKGLQAVSGILDAYTMAQPLPGVEPLPTVYALGEELRTLGLELIHKPTTGELQRTIATLKNQVELLQQLAVEQGRTR